MQRDIIKCNKKSGFALERGHPHRLLFHSSSRSWTPNNFYSSCAHIIGYFLRLWYWSEILAALLVGSDNRWLLRWPLKRIDCITDMYRVFRVRRSRRNNTEINGKLSSIGAMHGRQAFVATRHVLYTRIEMSIILDQFNIMQTYMYWLKHLLSLVRRREKVRLLLLQLLAPYIYTTSPKSSLFLFLWLLVKGNRFFMIFCSTVYLRKWNQMTLHFDNIQFKQERFRCFQCKNQVQRNNKRWKGTKYLLGLKQQGYTICISLLA